MKKRYIVIPLTIIIMAVAMFTLVTLTMEEAYRIDFKYTTSEAQSVETTTSFDAQPPSGYKFVIADITIINEGSESVSPIASWFRLHHEGHSYGADSVTYLYDGEHRYIPQTIDSGASLMCAIIFAVPDTMANYTIEIEPPSYISVV